MTDFLSYVVRTISLKQLSNFSVLDVVILPHAFYFVKYIPFFQKNLLHIFQYQLTSLYDIALHPRNLSDPVMHVFPLLSGCVRQLFSPCLLPTG